eukprot:scaffold29818_cov41-Tisochrysis_lutea.AAC.2
MRLLSTWVADCQHRVRCGRVRVRVQDFVELQHWGGQPAGVHRGPSLKWWWVAHVRQVGEPCRAGCHTVDGL